MDRQFSTQAQRQGRVSRQTVPDYFYEVKDLSMAPTFMPGDSIGITCCDHHPQSGDYVVVELGTSKQLAFKQYIDRGIDDAGSRIIDLVSLNRHYPAWKITANMVGRVIGVVVEHRKRLRQPMDQSSDDLP